MYRYQIDTAIIWRKLKTHFDTYFKYVSHLTIIYLLTPNIVVIKQLFEVHITKYDIQI